MLCRLPSDFSTLTPLHTHIHGLSSVGKAKLRFSIVLALQVRYQKGVQMMLDRWYNGEAFPEENYIVRDGELASQYS